MPFASQLRSHNHIRGALVAFTLLGTSCASSPYVWVQDFPREAEAVRTDGRIVAGDVLAVRVYGEEGLTTKGRVRLEGTLTVPLLGPVPVAGKLPTEVATDLAARFKPFVLDPRVIVTVEESIVTVTAVGEVKQAGLLELQSPATVLQALAKVGGLTDFASRSNIYVLRPQKGQTQRVRFAYDELVGGEPSAMAFHLKTGDVLVVE
ncbi:MAG: polysaccharide biosynthesis/export family protein [Polyangiales bacterium]